MNPPTPDFISKIAASSQTIASIEEHNFVPVSPSRTLSSVLRGANADLHCHYAAPEVLSSSPGSTGFLGFKNPGLESLPNLGNSSADVKRLFSGKEGNASSANQLVTEGRPASRIGPSSRAMVTAEDLGFVENLRAWLEARMGSSVLSRWGVAPGSKRVSNLWSELVGGESSLEDSKPPKRTTHVARVKIKNEEGLVLIEAYQEMSDGQRRVRNRALSEKMKPGEKVEEACLRGIFEELGAELGNRDRVTIVPESYSTEQKEEDSRSYPGLLTLYVIHSMEAQIKHLPGLEFFTEEDEIDHGGSAVNGGQEGTVGVNRHYWRWVSEKELEELSGS